MAGNRRTALENLKRAKAKWPGMPRSQRSLGEASLIQRLIWQWAHYAERHQIPRDCSIRQKARQLFCSHTHVRRQIALLRAHPELLQRITFRLGLATMLEWAEEHERSNEQRAMGMLRPRRVTCR